jgi:DNA-binding response OmpR family regulator
MAADRPCIVLIDDDPTFLELMDELLGQFEGYEVLTCCEADLAHELVKAHRPDLVILDVRLGDEESGWKVLERLSLDPETRRLPVLVCSAAIGERPAQEPLLQRRGVDVLPKPFDLDELLGKLRAALKPGAG